jgi:hypothetical protein
MKKMRNLSLAITKLAAALVLTVLVFGPVSSQAAQVFFEGNTATRIENVLCGDVPYDVEFVFQTGISLYGDPPDFPFKGASGDIQATTEEQTYFCSRAIQNALNAASQAITRVGQNSPYFYIAAAEESGETGEGGDPAIWGGFESRYYDTITTEKRPPDTWVPADNLFICIFDCPDGAFSPFPLGSTEIRRDVQYSYAKLTFSDGSPPPEDESVGGIGAANGGVTGLTGSGLVLQNNGGDDLSITGNGDFTFFTLLARGTTYSVTVKTQPSGPAQKCTVARGWGSVPAGGVSDVLVTCTDVPVSRTAFLPAVYQLLLLDE